MRPIAATEKKARRVRAKGARFGDVLDSVLTGFDERAAIRGPMDLSIIAEEDAAVRMLSARACPKYSRSERSRRLALLSERSLSREDVVAAAMAVSSGR